MSDPTPYAEDHAALSPALMVAGIALVYRNWPTGIRIDADGIRLGAVASSRAPSRRRLTVTHQAWGLFACPWAAVDSVRVVTEASELRELGTPPDHTTLNNRWSKPKGQRHCMTGVLSPRFMRAALAVRLDLTVDGVHVPELRRAWFYSQIRGRSALDPWPSWEWVAPTRHPEQLRAALDRFKGRIPRRPGPR